MPSNGAAPLDSRTVAVKEGARIPAPTHDKGKPSSTHHLIVDRHGFPLACAVIAANVHDSHLLAPLLDAIPPLHNGRRVVRALGRVADEGYGYRHFGEACVANGIQHRTAREGIEPKQQLGRHRWVVERTHAWCTCDGRLMIPYDRLVATHRAFLHLACALLCFNYLTQLDGSGQAKYSSLLGIRTNQKRRLVPLQLDFHSLYEKRRPRQSGASFA
jgi:hypothetical protein